MMKQQEPRSFIRRTLRALFGSLSSNRPGKGSEDESRPEGSSPPRDLRDDEIEKLAASRRPYANVPLDMID